MDILPAIDLLEGKVVRLVRGDYTRQTIYSDDPPGTAAALVEAGAKWIHVVDLDAARSSQPSNTAAIRAIRKAVNVRVQLGGGMRNTAIIEATLAETADRVVVGSAALKDWPWFEQLLEKDGLAGKIVLGLDARSGSLAAEGWTEQLQITPLELARRTSGWPLAAIVYTDITRDGMLTGPNIEATAELIAATDVPVIGSGGLSSLGDVLQCKAIGCAGVIIGRAYYEGKIDLAQACRLGREGKDSA